MVDIHCHLVPGVDDGAATTEVALAMLEEARAAGVTAIATTPHIRGRKEDHSVHEAHLSAFETIPRQSEIALQLGCEVRATSESFDVVRDPKFSYGEQGKYILLEMPHDHIPSFFPQLLFEYRLVGITPIVAHPERNAGVLKNPTAALDFVRQGALLQVTISSILGEIGEAFQKCSQAMLQCGIVSIVASDAHNCTTRSYKGWSRIEDALSEFSSAIPSGVLSGEELIETICRSNPRAVFEGKGVKSPKIEESQINAITKTLSSFSRLPSVKRKRFFFF